MAQGENGTVLANILMADLRPNMTTNRAEIDWELPGASNNSAQVNYFADGPCVCPMLYLPSDRQLNTNLQHLSTTALN